MLHTPDGQSAMVQSPHDDKLFQFKLGYFDLGIGGSAAAHIIGVVTDAGGACHCFAWETAERRLVEFDDNVMGMGYRAIGPLGLDNLRLKL